MSDPSDNACVEYLRPNSVPDGLIALGIVTQVTDNLIKLQITGGIVFTVPIDNISRQYTNKLKMDGEAPKLNQIFKIHQQFVCKVVEKRPRAGYADAHDIIATLDPHCLQENNSPKALLSIAKAPVQCSVQSIEDHGYKMDMGFKNLFGFLSNEDAEDNCSNKTDKLQVGQILRCAINTSKNYESDTRVVPLKIDTFEESAFSKDAALKHIVSERCVLPGSKSFLTVMKVTNDGLVVNFMGDFAGFVGKEQLKDFWHTPQNYKISNEFDCLVLYFNPLTKIFSLSIRDQDFRQETIEHFNENYYVGKFIRKATVSCVNGTRSIAFKVDKKWKAIANVKDALDDEITSLTKDDIIQATDEQYPIGSKHKCRIKSINFADQILIVSTKKEYMELPCASVYELKAGDFVEAKVKKFVKDGMIVTFGLNLRAIILKEHLQNYTSSKSYKKFSVGQPIKCRVLKVDLTKQPPRVYLTNKAPLMDSELLLVDSYNKSFKRGATQVIVSKVRPDGVIVELFNNVKGFIPHIWLGNTLKSKVEDLFKVGQVLRCTVVRIKSQPKSLILGVLPYQQIIKMKKEKKVKNKEKKISTKNKLDESNELTDKNLDELNKLTGKSRRQRSEEARLREEKLRLVEDELADPNRPPQSIPDFERLVLKSPNSADSWIKYSRFFLENVETEKARIVCRRALRTISFRMEKEKLKIWLQLVRIEAKFGGRKNLREVIDEAAQTTDKLALYQAAANLLAKCCEFEECDRLYKEILKDPSKNLAIWINYMSYLMEHRRSFNEARTILEKADKNLTKSDSIMLKSRFAQLEFKFGDVERGKTMFENLLSDNIKRTDLRLVYSSMILKYGSRTLTLSE